MADEILTAEVVRSLFVYDAESGLFTRRIRINKAAAGSKVGWFNACGYLQATIGQKKYRLHRLAWLYMTGEWPVGEVDHLNGVRTDNRWANLRDVSKLANHQNMRVAKITSKTGLIGVCSSGSGSKPYFARIRVGGRQRHLGSFATPQLAHEAYVAAKRVLHEGCTI